VIEVLSHQRRTGDSSSGAGRRGVTLLELILVMIILFIVAGVAAPRFSDFFPALQVSTTASRIVAWARKAHSDAALTGAIYRLVFDAEGKRYWLEYQPRPLREPETFEKVGGSWDEEPFPEDVTLEGLDALEEAGGFRYLEFRPDGTAGDFEFAVTNDRGDRRTIKVVKSTGQVTVLPLPEEE
jgi:Tfp pilus assembly protein FimT